MISFCQTYRRRRPSGLSIFFVLLLPGTVAGYVPFRILSAADQVRVPELSLSSAGASIVAIAGAVVLLRCVWDFFAKGRGTLAPIDPPRVLVVSGLYRFTRNPMYNGVLALILGEAWLFGSMSLLKYALLVFVLFHLFVVLYEEPALTSQFGESPRTDGHHQRSNCCEADVRRSGVVVAARPR